MKEIMAAVAVGLHNIQRKQSMNRASWLRLAAEYYAARHILRTSRTFSEDGGEEVGTTARKLDPK